MAFNIPADVQSYFWKCVMTGIFIVGTALAGKYLGSSAPSMPVPPTVMVQPVIVGQSADGTMRVLAIETPAKK